MPTEEKITYCQICEALCGLVATVENDRVIALRPDPEHPMSSGYCCPKGVAMVEIQNDPERVLYPLRKVGPDRFARTTWDHALAEIAERLREIRTRYGPQALAQYAGVPSSFSLGHLTWTRGFLESYGSPNAFGAVSQDVGSRLAACALLFGHPYSTPIPDLARTDLLLVIGANPYVSNGSFLTAPRVRERMSAITKRGGRIVVLDPRRTETARAFEHVAIRPDTDAWLLMSMLHVIFAEGLSRLDRLTVPTRGAEALQAMARDFPVARAAAVTGVPADTIRELARDFARSPSAVAYGRTGACRGRFGTLVSFLIDALNTVTGNLDRPGGALFTQTAIPIRRMAEAAHMHRVGRNRSQEGNLPDVLGELPTALMARQINAAGPNRIRALWISAGNPVTTAPNPAELTAALDQLDLLISHDLYINDTNRNADFILPAQTWLERSETPFFHAANHTSPFVQYSQRAVAPYGEARSEWEVMSDLGDRLGIVPSGVRAIRVLHRLGLRASPRRLVDLGLRLGPYGDKYGLRPHGLSLRRLERDYPNGLRLAEHHPTGVARKFVRHHGSRIELCPRQMAEEVRRLASTDWAADPEFPLLLVSLRELRSHNSWMHNSPKLMRNRRFVAHVHPTDAAIAGLAEEGLARLTSRSGSIEVPITLSDLMMPGTVSVPWAGVTTAAGRSPTTPEEPTSTRSPAHLSPISSRLQA